MISSDLEHCTSTQADSPPATTNGTDLNSHISEDRIVNNIKQTRGRPASCIFVARYHSKKYIVMRFLLFVVLITRYQSLSKLLKDSELCHSVAQHFAQWGTVLNVKVFRDWMQRPYGFVQFEVGGSPNAIKSLCSTNNNDNETCRT